MCVAARCHKLVRTTAPFNTIKYVANAIDRVLNPKSLSIVLQRRLAAPVVEKLLGPNTI